MENALIEQTVGKFSTQENFDLIAQGSSWLPRLQLFGANSDAVKEGKMAMAHYGLVKDKDTIEDLGTEIDVVPLNWRPKAMIIGDSGASPISYFDPQSDEFKNVQIKSEQTNSGCMFGPEFLVWIPKVKVFATFFLSSKTARGRAPDLLTIQKSNGTATLKIKLISNQKYSWHGPVVTVCSVPQEQPDQEKRISIESRFVNPESSSIEFDPKKLEEEQRAR